MIVFYLLFFQMTKEASVHPQKSKTCSFRVGIAHPPEWKIKSIAKYKAIQFKLNEAKKAAVAAAAASASASSFSSTHNASSSFSKNESQPELSAQKKAAAIEQIRRDLDILQYNGNAIRNKMQALTAVRYSLLWLLKKSTLSQRAIIATDL